MAQIYVTRKIHELGLDLLKEAGHELTISEKDGVLTKSELVTALKEKPYDAVLCLLTDKIDGEVMDAVPTAKIFANYAVGYDNINLNDAKERGVLISNTPGVLTESVAEHTFALVMALSKRIVEADSFTKTGKYKGWGPMLLLGSELKGKTLGLLGAGRIGTRVSEMAKCFGMDVIYYDIKKNHHIEDTGAVFKEDIESVMKESDFVSVHVPLLPSTVHLVNEERLKLMKPDAFLINTSRGPVVDEKALVETLKSNTIKGAALDVYENEPELAVGLAGLSNVILTPHTASATVEARSAMSRIAGENIIAVLNGENPPNLVS